MGFKESQKQQTDQSTFTKRPGTTDLGKDYETYVVAHFILKLLKNDEIENFRVWSNDDHFGAFDDVVIQIKSKKYAIQLKHLTADKTLKLQKLGKEKDDFSIGKYLKSFQEFEETLGDHILILWTNLRFGVKPGTTVTLGREESFQVEISECEADFLLKTTAKTVCHRFIPTLSKYEPFFRNFFLYSSQVDVDQLKVDLPANFAETFSCDTSVCQKYINFISEWSVRKGRKEKLDKETMRRVITLYLLDSSIQPISFGPVGTNAKHLQKAIAKFDVTVFENKLLDKVRKLWGDSRSELCDIQEVNRIRKQYQISPKHCTDVKDLSDEECTRILWLFGKCPLIVTSNDSIMEATKLCRDRQFVVIGTSRVSVFEKLSDLRPHDDIFNHVTTNFLCTVLGREITLGDLLKEDEEFGNVTTTGILLEMVDGPYVVCQEKEQLPVPYITRLVSKSVIDFKCLEMIDDNTLIVVSNVSDDEEEEIRKRGIFAHSLHITKDDYSNQKFQEICKKHERMKNIHNLRLDEGNLEWIRSSGSTLNLDEYHRGDHFLEEERLSISTDLNLVTDDPGMGKTIFLKSLKNTLSSHYWTTILTPRGISDFCRQDNTFDDFILDFKYSTNKFKRQVLKLLMRKGQVAYLWDALDEISESERTTIEDLILNMCDKVAVQWITSRRHLKKILEDKFRVLARRIQPFGKEQQRRYIHDRLGSDQVTDAIIRNVTSQNNILEIPLQIYMLTELFRQDPRKYESLVQELFNLNDLYHHFVEEKFILYFKEKSNIPCDTHSQRLVLDYLKTSRLRNYEEVALKTLFDETFLEQLNLKCGDFLEEIRSRGDWLGFVTEVERPQFAHTSYAEYFAAGYLARNARNIAHLDVIFDRKYTNVRYFFDMFFAKDSPAHVAVLCKNLKYLEEGCDLGCRDSMGRSLLHLASSWGERYPLLQVVNLLDIYIIDDKTNYVVNKEREEYKRMLDYLIAKCDLDEEDDLFHFNPVTYAEKCECLLSVAAIAQKQRTDYLKSKDDNFVCSLFYYGVKYGDSSVLDLFDDVKYIVTMFGTSLLHLASENNSHKHLEFLLLDGKYRESINCTNLGGGTPLHVAANYGTKHCADLLLRAQANVNAVDKDNRTPLYLASLYGREAVVELLIRYGANANIASKNNWTPLHPASGKGYIKIVDKLIICGANIDDAIDDGWTSLHLASFYKHESIINLLIEAGASVNARDKENWTPLHIVAKYGNDNIADLLLKAGADVNVCDSIKWTPLHLVSKYGNDRIADLLVEAGATVNAVNKDGSTSLYIASQYGKRRIVELLIKSGADIATPSSKGWTPLHISCQNCHDEVALLLIKSGANVNTTNPYGWTPLHITAFQGFDTTSDLLIRSGTNTEVGDLSGVTALQAASAGGHHKVVKLLLDAGSEVDVCDKDGTTPLIEACCRGYYQVAALLVNSGANVNTIDKNKMTPLGSAFYNKHERIVQLLIEAGADLEAIDTSVAPLYAYCEMGAVGEVRSFLEMGASTETVAPSGWRPIHVACSKGHVEVVKVLVDAGADFNAVTSSGETPLEIATRNGHAHVADLLREYLYKVNLMVFCYRWFTPIA